MENAGALPTGGRRCYPTAGPGLIERKGAFGTFVPLNFGAAIGMGERAATRMRRWLAAGNAEGSDGGLRPGSSTSRRGCCCATSAAIFRWSELASAVRPVAQPFRPGVQGQHGDAAASLADAPARPRAGEMLERTDESITVIALELRLRRPEPPDPRLPRDRRHQPGRLAAPAQGGCRATLGAIHLVALPTRNPVRRR